MSQQASTLVIKEKSKKVEEKQKLKSNFNKTCLSNCLKALKSFDLTGTKSLHTTIHTKKFRIFIIILFLVVMMPTVIFHIGLRGKSQESKAKMEEDISQTDAKAIADK